MYCVRLYKIMKFRIFSICCIYETNAFSFKNICENNNNIFFNITINVLIYIKVNGIFKKKRICVNFGTDIATYINVK